MVRPIQLNLSSNYKYDPANARKVAKLSQCDRSTTKDFVPGMLLSKWPQMTIFPTIFIQRKINRRTQPCPFCLIVAVSEKNLNLMRTFHWPFNFCKMKMLSPSNRFILDKFALCRTTAVFNCLQLILLDWESNQGPLAPQPSINCATETLQHFPRKILYLTWEFQKPRHRPCTSPGSSFNCLQLSLIKHFT